MDTISAVGPLISAVANFGLVPVEHRSAMLSQLKPKTRLIAGCDKTMKEDPSPCGLPLVYNVAIHRGQYSTACLWEHWDKSTKQNETTKGLLVGTFQGNPRGTPPIWRSKSKTRHSQINRKPIRWRIFESCSKPQLADLSGIDP